MIHRAPALFLSPLPAPATDIPCPSFHIPPSGITLVIIRLKIYKGFILESLGGALLPVPPEKQGRTARTNTILTIAALVLLAGCCMRLSSPLWYGNGSMTRTTATASSSRSCRPCCSGKGATHSGRQAAEAERCPGAPADLRRGRPADHGNRGGREFRDEDLAAPDDPRSGPLPHGPGTSPGSPDLPCCSFS